MCRDIFTSACPRLSTMRFFRANASVDLDVVDMLKSRTEPNPVNQALEAVYITAPSLVYSGRQCQKNR